MPKQSSQFFMKLLICPDAGAWPKTTSAAAFEQCAPPGWGRRGLGPPRHRSKIEMLTPKGEHFPSPLFYQG
jgi:hypothetical protein